MLDSGSVAYTFSEQVEAKMLNEGALSEPKLLPEDVVLVGCEGNIPKPKCMFETELKIYGESCIVPVLVVPGQREHFELFKDLDKLRFPCHVSSFHSLASWILSRGFTRLDLMNLISIIAPLALLAKRS